MDYCTHFEFVTLETLQSDTIPVWSSNMAGIWPLAGLLYFCAIVFQAQAVGLTRNYSNCVLISYGTQYDYNKIYVQTMTSNYIGLSLEIISMWECLR